MMTIMMDQYIVAIYSPIQINVCSYFFLPEISEHNMRFLVLFSFVSATSIPGTTEWIHDNFLLEAFNFWNVAMELQTANKFQFQRYDFD